MSTHYNVHNKKVRSSGFESIIGYRETFAKLPNSHRASVSYYSTPDVFLHLMISGLPLPLPTGVETARLRYLGRLSFKAGVMS